MSAIMATVNAQDVRNILIRELTRSFESFTAKLSTFLATTVHGIHITMPTIEDHSNELQIRLRIRSGE